MSAATVKTEVAAALQFASLVAQFIPGAGPIVGQVLQLAPEAMNLVSAVMGMAAEGRGPTAEEQAALDALIAENSRKIHDAGEKARAALAGQNAGG